MSDTLTTWTGTLTDEQREFFVTKGYLLLRGALDGANAKAWVRDECMREGYDLDDPETWTKEYVRIPTVRKERLAEYAPAAWEASCALMGGEDRVKGKPGISLFAVNFRQGADRPFAAPSPESPGWHKDGWHFRHFLDSYEQGLLGIPLMTDVVPQGGATFVAAGSVATVARFLAERPEGVHPDGFPVAELLRDGERRGEIEYIEAAGSAGDIYLCHPYLLHAVSQNVRRLPRAICNILYELNEPMQFDRPSGDFSPVEAAVLHGLGVDHLPFAATGERYRTPDYGPMNPKYR